MQSRIAEMTEKQNAIVDYTIPWYTMTDNLKWKKALKTVIRGQFGLFRSSLREISSQQVEEKIFLTGKFSTHSERIKR